MQNQYLRYEWSLSAQPFTLDNISECTQIPRAHLVYAVKILESCSYNFALPHEATYLPQKYCFWDAVTIIFVALDTCTFSRSSAELFDKAYSNLHDEFGEFSYPYHAGPDFVLFQHIMGSISENVGYCDIGYNVETQFELAKAIVVNFGLIDTFVQENCGYRSLPGSPDDPCLPLIEDMVVA